MATERSLEKAREIMYGQNLAMVQENREAFTWRIALAFDDARAEVWMECAGIARAHIGSAAKKRHERGQKLSTLDPMAVDEIQAEERGEDIAAEMIERAIRARAKEGGDG